MPRTCLVLLGLGRGLPSMRTVVPNRHVAPFNPLLPRLHRNNDRKIVMQYDAKQV